jgi:hypothetical protein
VVPVSRAAMAFPRPCNVCSVPATTFRVPRQTLPLCPFKVAKAHRKLNIRECSAI